MKHIETLLTQAGLPEDKVAEIMALPADKAGEFKADDYVATIRGNMETAIKNDPRFWEGLDENNVNEGFKKKIESAQYGRAAGIAKQKVLKALGMTEDDLADLPAEERGKYEIVVAKAAEKYASSKAGDKQLQQQLVDTRKKLEELEAGIPEKEGKLKEQYETRFNDEKLDFIVLAEVATIEGLKVPPQYVADKIAAELKNTYAFKLNGVKAEPKQKSNPNLDVIEGTKTLSLKDLAIKILERDNLIEKKQDPIQQPHKGKVVIEPVDGKLTLSSHIADKIAANTPKS